ncbi:MAG: flippase-like domain-containing protein [Spirochaetes bacterium]|jgi:hypothetical protein|nr:flippase-like domain-containing protein [Spirochaetota bacterium]
MELNNGPGNVNENEIITERKKRIFSLKTLVFFILSAFIAGVLIYNLELDKTGEILKKADPSLMAAACLIYFLSNFFKALRFFLLLRQEDMGLVKIYIITSFHNFFNMILPARTGELTFVFYLKKIGGASVSRGLHLLVVTRVFDFITISAVFVCAIILYYGAGISILMLSLGIFFLVMSIIMLFNLKRFMILFRNIFSAMVSAFNLSENTFVKKISLKIDSLAGEFSDFETMRHIPGLAFSSILTWMALYSMFHVAILSLGIEMDFLGSVLGSTGGVLTNVLPINSFGSFGTLEAGWAGGFLLVGMSRQDAIISGFGYHALSFIASGIVALISYAIFKIKKYN